MNPRYILSSLNNYQHLTILVQPLSSLFKFKRMHSFNISLKDRNLNYYHTEKYSAIPYFLLIHSLCYTFSDCLRNDFFFSLLAQISIQRLIHFKSILKLYSKMILQQSYFKETAVPSIINA